MLGLRLRHAAYECMIRDKRPGVMARTETLAMTLAKVCYGILLGRPRHGCSIKCFVTVSDDYGYGFTLYDPYGNGERRIR